jgi:rod shape-determining protein MreC
LLSWGIRSGGDWTILERLFVEITAPVQSLASSGYRYIEGLWLGYFYLVGAREENLKLKKENEELRREAFLYRELISGCERYEELNQFKKSLNLPTVTARVTSVDPSGAFRSIIINKGGSDGLDLDMPVISARGVVGRIVSISYNYSKVLLITDQNSAVDCFIQRSRERGMVKGLSGDLCSVEYVPVTGDVAVDDTVVTSGLEGIYPKGIPVGRITAVRDASGGMFKEIEMEPYVPFSRLEEVLVVLGGEQR